MGSLLAKPETTKEVEDGAGKTGRWSYGVSSMQGWRKAQEDSHLALPDFDTKNGFGLFGVFDGHGGAEVAKLAALKLPEVLKAMPSYKVGDYNQALQDAFLQLDAFIGSPEGRRRIKDGESKNEKEALSQVQEHGMLEDSEEDMEEGEEEEEDLMEEGEEEETTWESSEGPNGMGCTAVVALVRTGAKPEVYCANAGDSRCVLVRGAKALDMSRDHKPELKSERTRIEKAGGFVTEEGRVDGNLNLSRALGDFAYKKDKKLKPQEQKISCEAEMRHRELTGADGYLLIGCDGIFEKASSQALVDFMLPKLLEATPEKKPSSSPLSSVCSAFLDYNIAESPSKERGLGCDNMTLMAVKLGDSTGPVSAAASPNGKQLPKNGLLFVRRGIAKPERRRLIMRAYQLRKAKAM